MAEAAQKVIRSGMLAEAGRVEVSESALTALDAALRVARETTTTNTNEETP